MMQNGLFENVMTDVSGKVRLESEDPRWIQLFSAKNIDNLVDGAEISWYGNRLIEHNPVTGNLVQLLEQTATRLNQVTSRKTVPANQFLEQCCISLHLSSLVMHHMITSLPQSVLTKQLFLTDSWFQCEVKFGKPNMQGSAPSADSSDGTGIAQGSRVLESLIQELAIAIDSPPANSWMRDVKFFSMDLLLCLCSTQLYANHHQYDRNGAPLAVAGFNSEADIFLNYIFGKAEKQLRVVLGSAQHTSSAFSGCLAVQLVRGLVLTASYSEGSGAASSSVVGAVRSRTVQPKAPAVTKGSGMHAHSQLFDRLTARYGSASVVDKSAAASAAGVGGLSATSGGVAEILISLLKFLPFGALHRLFAGQQAITAPTTMASDSADTSSTGAQSPFTVQHPSSVPVPVVVQGAMSLPANALAERSLDLLLILLHNRRSPFAKKANPFREAFGLLHDRTIDVSSQQEGDEEGGNTVDLSASRDQRSASVSSTSGAGDAVGMLMQGQGGRGAAGSSSSQLLMDASRIHVSFLQLIEALGRGLPAESSSLLLYSLLQAHPTFLEALISTDSLEHVLMACMRGLYTLTAKPSKKRGDNGGGRNQPAQDNAKGLNQLYVLVVCILLTVQDSSVLQELSKQHTVEMDWFKERQLHSATLMDASLLSLLRCLTHSLFRLQDEYLVSNSCAILHNLASSLTAGLLPYTAERLVKVTCQLCQRAVKACEAREKVVSGEQAKAVPMFDPRSGTVSAPIVVVSPESSSSSTVPVVLSASKEREASLLSTALSTLLALMFTALRKERLAQNVHLLYALMHESDTVEAHFSHPAVTAILATAGLPGDLGSAILSTTKEHLAAVEALGGENHEHNFSAAQTVEFLVSEIRKSALNDKSAAHVAAAARAAATSIVRKKYTYQEAENPEEFFLPCIWTCTMRNTPELPWQLLQTTLIDPLAAGFITLQDPGSTAASIGGSSQDYTPIVLDNV